VLGTSYLASVLRQYGGKEELALAAYNAGGARVEQWQSRFGNVDMAEFVERIPFSETRGYIKQVLTNKAYYSLLRESAGDSLELASPEALLESAPAPKKTAPAASRKRSSKPKTGAKAPSRHRKRPH
jgi:soluble lytic murein transglycosylase